MNLPSFIRTHRRWFTALGVAIGTLSFASASDRSRSPEVEAVEAALAMRDTVVSDLSSDQIRYAVQETMNTVVDEALWAMRKEGYSSEAKEQENEWNAEFYDFLMRGRSFDLGDHRPLIQWLARFHRILELTIGKKAAHQGVLGDVYELNYAIPVVFGPHGDWRTNSIRRDTKEYRKHFVPMAEIVTYWTTLLSCESVMKSRGVEKQGRKLCTQVAEKLSDAMMAHLAPKLSDYVFRKVNGLDTQLEITDEDLVYLNARDLLGAVGSDLR